MHLLRDFTHLRWQRFEFGQRCIHNKRCEILVFRYFSPKIELTNLAAGGQNRIHEDKHVLQSGIQ